MLAETMAVPDSTTGDWQTTIIVPPNVVGLGRVVASQGEQEHSAALYIRQSNQPQPESDPFIFFYRPVDGETAVAGYPVFFEGEVKNPIDNSVTIGVLTEDCTVWAALQTFTVGGGGKWTGSLILPNDMVDEKACAAVYTGVYGEDDWREVQKPLPVYAPDDERAMRLSLANPSPLEFIAGGTAQLSGTAVAAPEVQVTISNNETGDVISEGTAPVGDFGLWQIELPIAEDAPDVVHIQIMILDDPPLDEPYFMTTGATIIR